jgi:hypothetical protein
MFCAANQIVGGLMAQLEVYLCWHFLLESCESENHLVNFQSEDLCIVAILRESYAVNFQGRVP